MGGVSNNRRRIWLCLFVVSAGVTAAVAHQCSHDHDHLHHHHHHEYGADVDLIRENRRKLLPEEIAEEEDLRMMLDHSELDRVIEQTHRQELSGIGLWLHAMACSLLVSLASLICLVLLPVIFIQGKPSKIVVDSLALFGAGAMLGDAFLHQLPHAFGGEHSHSHDHHDDHAHHHHGVKQSHSHSLKDLSIGLSVLAGIVVFLIVEKLVRYVEEFSGVDGPGLGHHHHHHHKHAKKVKADDATQEDPQEPSYNDVANGRLLDQTSDEKELNRSPTESASGDKSREKTVLRKRNTSIAATKEGTDLSAENNSDGNLECVEKKEPVKTHSSLVFGYLNLFSDGVHNFTDGMALGSAFLVYGSVGGWSRTLFLLAHELPQEIGDFGILVRSGFSVSKALFFNFLSALVALAGTALALMWGKDPGQSSLIEGFTAGGFIYIALAGVLAEMNNNGTTAAPRHTMTQLISLVSGMGVALCISLVE
ncbi:IAA-alanine resistance protein 1 [Andrographis paniculata]|uniref:IAA-alanine resistance protein 1 n=1 Tax=Andrographis paniculata TaxID=175694 RepID=UPI0021E87628|nr:IAA-alanine resistance protein 1 [Andrographis paniculata]